MSTIWEMAAIIRDEETRGLRVKPMRRSNLGVDIDGPGRIEYWCKYFGTTPLNLYCAIDVVGSEPNAVRRFLSARGRPPWHTACAIESLTIPAQQEKPHA